MTSFNHTLPYDRMMGDVYVNECPFCHSENVLTPMTERDFEQGLQEIKTRLVMPCCNGKVHIVKIDDDYFWTTQAVRNSN
ncbi:hypothetical protein [Guptibacillus algicola]|uniref:hypothetical protein n=1 Tax=Guptibacillus algicola TaxID=225844 RepID=UPI001CD3C24C|nr:hypothetical protein [Alkalihalobacillus algicola]MCA0986634.1 hypothetical protein [Alkalihalobacillus algicola]